MLQRKEILLPAFPRGIHSITSLVENFLDGNSYNGILHVFLKHTSAALTINENADPTVLHDLSRFSDLIAPDSSTKYAHDSEGSDDMPAHIKSSMFGCSLTIPVVDGKLALGTWQGVYLCEFRNSGGRRKLLLTLLSA
ncbi:MAG: secondary thiamine-phosphate synthase enzyme YjbQ [Bacteroidota bacterium]